MKCDLRGRVKFPTGGDGEMISQSASRFGGRNRCESGTDSTVWMEEDITAERSAQ